MFGYVTKDLKNQFTKQRLLSLLLVINIVVSCLVICFSYGIYQNYNVFIDEGEQEEATDIDVLVKEENLIPPDEKTDNGAVVDVSPSMLMDMIFALSEDTRNSIDMIIVGFIADTPISKDTSNIEFIDLEYYSDDAEPFYLMFRFKFALDGDKFIDKTGSADHFTDEQFNSGEKYAIVAKELYSPKHTFGEVLPYDISWTLRKLPEGSDSLIIGGERYKIIGTVPEAQMTKNYISIPVTAIPEGAKLYAGHYDFSSTKSCIGFYFKEPITRDQYTDIKNCLSYLGDDVFLEEIQFTEAKEIYYYKTIMLISVVIAVLAAINMAILYRYILEKRSGELAIFRICGCSKGRAVASYLLECLVINAPLFVITELVYHKLIMPRLTGIFPNMAGAYSIKLYSVIFGIYIAASTLVMLVMIVFTIRKHSLVALKSSPRATSRFGIMKLFEILQLAAVLSILVLIVSAIMSRYSLFTPFEPYLERRGYMVNSTDPVTYDKDFEELIGSADYIMNQQNSFALSDGTVIEGISYSDEFIEAYAPPLDEGIWLDDTTETYENSGYIPAVITYCDGRYKIGDIIEQEVALNVNENGEPTDVICAKYKIIGILKDKVSVASYMNNNDSMPNRDYRDIYDVFSDSFEKKDYLLTRLSDQYACFNTSSLVWGTQFIFCDGMTDDEYEEVGRKLSSKFSAAPLSEVYDNSKEYIYEQMYTLFPIAVCIFILTIISTVSINAIYTKRQLRNYAIFYICGARWRSCALRSLKNSAMTCGAAAALSAIVLIIGKLTFWSETVITFGWIHLTVCAGVILLYLALSMIMPLSIIGSAEPREVLKEE